jgi:putative tricarboxylic transport membrane protein
MTSADQQQPAGETPRLRGEDESGAASGRRDVAGLVIAVALFALAIVIVTDASGYPIRRSYAQFGPEIVPYIVATGIVGLGALTVMMAWRGGFEARPRLNYEGLIWIIGAILLEIGMLYGGSGFIPASAVLFGFAARAFGQKTLLLNLAIGAVLSTLLFLLFRYGLGLALPSGPLERVIDLLLR